MPDGGSTAALRAAAGANDVALARTLFVEYAAWLQVDLCFQGFDRELATLPGAYSPPAGRLLLAGAPGEAFGCIALRPLAATGQSSATGQPSPRPETEVGTAVGEVKRLYVRPERRGAGWGRKLAEAVIGDARAIGYRELKLDTLEWMGEARTLYGKLGFRECPKYYDNPHPGVVYMSLRL
jgi:GNAT superfamily N-acetyltransferase